MKKQQTEFFSTKSVSVEGLFTNQYDSSDSGKNYLIPIYQRRYVWEKDQIEKLIDDIVEVCINDTNKTSPYFIGGIVLCQEPTEEKYENTFLEVIDGQQRLTTLSLILAAIYFQLKYNSARDYKNQKDWVDEQMSVLEKLLFKKQKQIGTFDLETVLTVTRSDEIQDVYKEILLSFKNGDFIQKIIKLNTIQPSKNMSKLYSERIVNNAIAINNKLKSFDDFFLLEFTEQLLSYTFIVVTKTIDVDTGFLVFEKLNDNGSPLEPEDLLKNYLFSESEDYNELKSKWVLLINTIEKINPGKAKLLPREFLSHYLIIKSITLDMSSSNKIFSTFKKYMKNERIDPISLLDDLLKIANEYKIIKANNEIRNYFTALNFKLGYVILLTYFDVDKKTYKLNFSTLLANVVILELTYILSRNSKLLSTLVVEVCTYIQKNGSLTSEDDFFKDKLLIVKEDFINTMKNLKIAEKKKASKLFLYILNYHYENKKLPYQDLTVDSLISLDTNNDTTDETINVDNIKTIVNSLGNLTLTVKQMPQYEGISAKDRVDFLLQNNPVNLTCNTLDTDLFESDTMWNKLYIENRTETLIELAVDILFNNNFNEEIFN